MAYYGLSTIIIAKLDTSNDTYSQGMIMAKAVSVNVEPNYAEGSLYADDKQAEYEKSFNYATVDLGVDTIPVEAGKLLFGRTDGDTGEVVSSSTDEAGYVGTGYINKEVVDGVRFYTGVWLTKCLYTEGADNAQTKTESITFNSQSLSGRALANSSNKWRIIKRCTTEAEALAWLKTKANIAA